jgi:tetratricopeptide (TPR) repeat protein
MKRSLQMLVVAATSWLAQATVSHAETVDTSTIETARTGFRQGVKLFNEGSFEAALAEFRKGYRLSPNYRILYNIAQTYFELHDYVNAQEALKQYLRDGKSEIPATRRVQVAELNNKLEERIGHLTIVCNLDGADVRVDDLSVATSPLDSAIPVNAGPRRISAVKAGYPVAAQMVTVSGRDAATLVLEIPLLKQRSPIEATSPSAASATGTRPTPSLFAERIGEEKHRQGSAATLGLVVTGSCAAATAVFSWLAWRAKGDFEREIGKIPTSRARVDSARSTLKTYAYASDAFAVATLLSAGMTGYFLFSDKDEADQSKRPRRSRSVGLAPTLGGAVFQGVW